MTSHKGVRMGNVIAWLIAHKEVIAAIVALFEGYKAGDPKTKYQGIVRTVLPKPDQPSQ